MEHNPTTVRTQTPVYDGTQVCALGGAPRWTVFPYSLGSRALSVSQEFQDSVVQQQGMHEHNADGCRKAHIAVCARLD